MMDGNLPMAIANKKEALLLFLGDLAIFFISISLALYLRHLEWPDRVLFQTHLVPFGLLSLLWVFVFFIAGLYEKHTLFLRSRLPNILFNAQMSNAFLAVVFFYLVPQFGINPKTNLFIYIVVSSILIFLWRLYGREIFISKERDKALIIGSGKELSEIKEEINNNSRYNLFFAAVINLDQIGDANIERQILKQILADGISVIVVDFDNQKIEPILPHLYDLIFSQVNFVDMDDVYEEIFDRVPVTLLKDSWFLENISLTPKMTYNIFKRAMDIVIAFFLGIFSLIFYPLVYLAIKMEDGGEVFIVQERIGQNNQRIKIIKFRTMAETNSINVLKDEAGRVTKVGSFLRKSRIDELPQLYNVLRGDISLIGPRPELPQLVELYQKEIPHYDIRHLIKPGISGWAQLYQENHPHHGGATMATKEKLSYDLYYIKNRGVMLDLKIALKTIKTLLSRTGV